jgi:glycosyltransferase involved in cell wall biosynthesis
MDDYRSMADAEAWTLLHFGVCGRANDMARDLPGKFILYYHNVTPAAFYAPYNPLIVTCMRQARRQLATLVSRGRAIAASDYNQVELESMGFQVDAVAPYIMLLDRIKQGLQTPAAEAARQQFKVRDVKTWLYVGRMAPNKKIEDVIRAFGFYHANHEPASRLLLVGAAKEKDAYVAFLKGLIAELGLTKSVIFPGHLPAEALGVFYELADAYICLSEHEGFCVPLVEAMSFDVPVVAFASTGMPSTLGDSGVLLHRKEPALVAEVMHEVLTNPALRQGLIARQRRRVADFEPGKMRLQLHRSLIAAGIPLPEPVVA